MIGVGVVGLGYWGPKHVRVFHELGEARVTQVCDLDEKRLQQVKVQYPLVEISSSFKDFLQGNLDAVVISTPVNTHFQLAREALLAGKHVLIEKPITASSIEALELIEIAEKQNLVLMAGHTYEYHPVVDYMRDAMAAGALGEIYCIDSSRLNLGLYRPDINVLWDLAPHDISIMLTILQEMPVSVSARGTYHTDARVCDMAYLEIVFANGTMGHAHVSWLHPRKIRELTVVGSKKMAVYNDISESEKLYIYDKGVAFAADGTSSISAWPPDYRYGDVVIPFIANAEPLKQECSHFLTCIAENKKPKSDGWAGLRVTSILEAADRSLMNGGERVELDSTPTFSL